MLPPWPSGCRRRTLAQINIGPAVSAKMKLQNCPVETINVALGIYVYYDASLVIELR